MQKITYTVVAFIIAYTNGLAIANDGEAYQSSASLLERDDNLDITSPFHKCLLGGQTVDACVAQAGLTSPNPQKRGVLGTVSNALGSVKFGDISFSGEENCYKALGDKYSWVSDANLDNLVQGACQTVVPNALKAAGAGGNYATWQDTVTSLAYPNYKVPIYLTVAIKGADLLTHGGVIDIGTQACKDAITHILKDQSCVAKRKEGTTPNGGQVVQTWKTGNFLQTIFELGDINGPQDTCKTQYKVVLDSFEIKGKNFDAAKIGDDGSLLQKQVKGCGLLKSWKFSKQAADGFEWSASGTLPIGTKACLGRAIKTVGGTDTCSGSS